MKAVISVTSELLSSRNVFWQLKLSTWITQTCLNYAWRDNKLTHRSKSFSDSLYWIQKHSLCGYWQLSYYCMASIDRFAPKKTIKQIFFFSFCVVILRYSSTDDGFERLRVIGGLSVANDSPRKTDESNNRRQTVKFSVSDRTRAHILPVTPLCRHTGRPLNKWAERCGVTDHWALHGFNEAYNRWDWPEWLHQYVSITTAAPGTPVRMTGRSEGEVSEYWNEIELLASTPSVRKKDVRY